LFVEGGPFYEGDRVSAGFSGGRVNLSSQLAIEPGVTVDRVTLPFGAFTTALVRSRVTYTVTPLMFVSGLVQFNSGTRTVSANVRLRWEYRPGSELFVVLNEERDTQARHFPDLTNRAIIVKMNRLLRF
jgi:hypothetical protein